MKLLDAKFGWVLKCKYIQILLVLVLFFYGSSSVVHAQKQVDSLLKVLRTTKTDTTKIALYLKLSNLLIKVDLFQSKLYIDSAFVIAQKYNLPKYVAAAKHELGTFYFYKGSFKLAADNYLEYLKYQEKIGNKQGICKSKIHIGNIYYSQKKYKDALECYQDALEIIQTATKNDPSFVRVIYPLLNNIANVYEDQDNNGQAFEYYRRALVLARQVDDRTLMGNICNNLGKLFLKTKQKDSALIYYKIGLQSRLSINDKLGSSRSYRNLGNYYLQAKDYKLAKINLEKGLKLTQETGELQTSFDIYGMLAEVFANLKDFESAFNAERLKSNIADSIYNETVNQEVMKVELEHKFQQREEQTQIEQQKKNFIYIIIGSVLFSIILIFSFLYFLSRSRNKRISLKSTNLQLEKNILQISKDKLELEKITLEKDLEIRNKELATNVIYLVRKNELLNLLSKKLLGVKEKLNADDQPLIQRIVYEIQSNLDTEVWKEFELRFQQVHSDFYKNLQASFSELTPNEIKLCAFLRLNMSSKDIAVLLHINDRSIVVARARLRKKLNLTNSETDLVSFLSNF